MRVLVVVHGFPPDAQGGTELYAEAHVRTLARRHDDEVLVITREQDRGRPEYAVRREQRDGLAVVWINNTFRNTRTFEDSYRNEMIGSIAEHLIDEFRPDVAHVHHLTCLSTLIVPALAERGIPCFLTLHDYWLICHRGQLLDLDLQVCNGPDASGCCRRCLGPVAGAPPLALAAARALRRVSGIRIPNPKSRIPNPESRVPSRWREREEAESRRRTAHMRDICRQITHFFAPSEYIRDRFVRFGVAPDRITQAPLGLEQEGSFDDPVERVAKAGPYDGGNGSRPDGEPLRLGFLGSLMVSKAPHLLLEATRSLEPGQVTVDVFGGHAAYHGDDSYRLRLEPLLAAAGVRAHGSLPHQRVPAALATLDALVVPSIWPENSPMVIQEAFLAGTPVIASRIGGIPEIVADGENGLLFEPGNVDDLRRTIVRLVREPDLLERLCAGIRPARTIEADAAFTREMYDRVKPRPRTAAAVGRQRISAVVLNYRTPDDTALAVQSLLASSRCVDEIVVVDNDVVESARDVTARFGSRVTYLHTGANRGFSGGVNVGVRAALDRGADCVLLVNSDVVVAPDCLERLEQALDDAPSAGIVGPLIASRTAPDQIASLGISYNEHTGRVRQLGVGNRVPAHPRESRPVDAVSACLVLIRRDVFAAVGLFDENYFFSFEDIDFCRRARQAGFSSIVVERAVAFHEGGRSLGAASPRRFYFATRNHLLLASRAAPRASWAARVARSAFIVSLNLAYAAISDGGSLPERLSAVGRGTRDYLAGRYGADQIEAPAVPR
jgi:GT2 family glycosyltransferase/glycosyltransferase involved in cell wall biosynthesis